MTVQPGGLALPPLPRALLLAGGTILIAAALRLMRRRAGPAEPGDVHGPGALGRAVRAAGTLAAHLPALRRTSDPATLSTRLAIAPQSWPARSIAAGLRAEAAAAARRPHIAQTPDLVRTAAGVRLLAAVAIATPLTAACIPWVGAAAAAVLGSVGLACGARLPDVALAAAARRALRAGRHDAAATVDLLAATASAGLSLPEAMVLSAGHAPPALAAVLRGAAVRRAMGDEPGEALTAEARRYGVAMLGDVAQAMGRQRRLGVPLGDELSRIATRMRAEQRSATLRRAARRGPLGTLVVALVIAPTCLAAVIGCLVGGLLQGGALTLR